MTNNSCVHVESYREQRLKTTVAKACIGADRAVSCAVLAGVARWHLLAPAGTQVPPLAWKYVLVTC